MSALSTQAGLLALLESISGAKIHQNLILPNPLSTSSSTSRSTSSSSSAVHLDVSENLKRSSVICDESGEEGDDVMHSSVRPPDRIFGDSVIEEKYITNKSDSNDDTNGDWNSNKNSDKIEQFYDASATYDGQTDIARQNDHKATCVNHETSHIDFSTKNQNKDDSRCMKKQEQKQKNKQKSKKDVNKDDFRVGGLLSRSKGQRGCFDLSQVRGLYDDDEEEEVEEKEGGEEGRGGGWSENSGSTAKEGRQSSSKIRRRGVIYFVPRCPGVSNPLGEVNTTNEFGAKSRLIKNDHGDKNENKNDGRSKNGSMGGENEKNGNDDVADGEILGLGFLSYIADDCDGVLRACALRTIVVRTCVCAVRVFPVCVCIALQDVLYFYVQYVHLHYVYVQYVSI